MADIAIARYDANTSWLPPICPKHGRPADHAISRKFSTPTPGWVYLLLVVSLLIAAIAQSSMQNSDEVALPGCPDCTGAARTRLLIRWGVGVAALLVLAAAIATGSVVAILLFVVVALAWLVTLSSLMDMGQVSGKLDGQWLRLTGVHPAFVAAIRPNPAWQQAQYPVQPPPR